MKALLSLVCLAAASSAWSADANRAATTPAPIRALLITGGCCHDYPRQTAAYIEGVKTYAEVAWTVSNEGGTNSKGISKLYDDPDWAKPYDVVVHNECFGEVADAGYIRKITAAHRAGRPSVVIHCAMHSYRAAVVDDWREFVGVTSRKHDHKSRYAVTPVAPDHATLRHFPSPWITPRDELYIIEKLWPTAQPLAVSTSERDGKAYPVVWTNDYHGTRVFGTTFGHDNITWEDPVFIALISRGLLWAAGRED